MAKGMAPMDAVNAPRLHHQLVPSTLFAENQYCLGDTRNERKVPADLVAALRSKGHVVEYSSEKTATTQLIVVDRDSVNGTAIVHAASDPRKGGKPAAQKQEHIYFVSKK
jgi:gamma-glutamyltranspeptidase